MKTISIEEYQKTVVSGDLQVKTTEKESTPRWMFCDILIHLIESAVLRSKRYNVRTNIPLRVIEAVELNPSR